MSCYLYCQKKVNTFKTRLVLTLRDFPDELIREAGTETHTNRKWSAIETVNQEENSFKHKEIVGVTAVERQVIGVQQRQYCGADQTRRRGEANVNAFRSKENRGTCKGRRDMSAWCIDYVEETDRKITWGHIWKYKPLISCCLLRSDYDLPLFPENLCRRGLTTDPKCSLCDKPGT